MTIKHRAKKSLGQNFLTSKKVVLDIIEASDIKAGETVLEIGPGKGVLTETLLEKGANVLAIEKDDELFSFLQEKFQKEIEEKKLKILNEDVLDFEDLPKKYKIVANIPYNITGEIFKKFLSAENQPEMMILMVQKEVADRILARDGKESVLSMSIKTYGEPFLVRNVKASFFKPKPKVDSAVLGIKNISKELFEDVSEEDFFKILKEGFKHKRKTLKNNLSIHKNTEECLLNCSIEPSIRAEKLTIGDWYCLVKTLTDSFN